MTTVKESSDELNPPHVISSAAIGQAEGAHSVTDYLALTIATCGVGYFPLAPGTWGSLVGVAIFLGVQRFRPASAAQLFVLAELVLIALVTVVGIWAASQTERLSGRKDPGKVVIDEVAGQLIALLPVPFLNAGWWSIVAAFLFFRLFDIVKPYPARRLERLHAGFGIMCDDLVAGVYAAAATLITVVAFHSIT
jgi:phosphatidylglycerophosphatase A